MRHTVRSAYSLREFWSGPGVIPPASPVMGSKAWACVGSRILAYPGVAGVVDIVTDRGEDFVVDAQRIGRRAHRAEQTRHRSALHRQPSAARPRRFAAGRVAARRNSKLVPTPGETLPRFRSGAKRAPRTCAVSAAPHWLRRPPCPRQSGPAPPPRRPPRAPGAQHCLPRFRPRAPASVLGLRPGPPALAGSGLPQPATLIVAPWISFFAVSASSMWYVPPRTAAASCSRRAACPG